MQKSLKVWTINNINFKFNIGKEDEDENVGEGNGQKTHEDCVGGAGNCIEDEGDELPSIYEGILLNT